MINLLELTKRQTLIASAVTVAIGLAMIVGLGVFVAAQSNKARQAFGSQPVTVKSTAADNSEKQTVEVPAVQSNTQDAPAADPVTSAPKPAPVQTAPQPTSEPQPAKTEPMERIPYTNKPVTPGDPESYVGTVGQCPFYEIAGPKGCVVPPNIECNDDWTVCRLVDTVTGKLGL